jgi:hypothetical protein
MKRSTGTLLDASKEVGPKVNRENKVCVDVLLPECQPESYNEDSW